MRKNLFLFLVLLSSFYWAQVGVGTVTPNSKSVLEIQSNDKGVLMPRLTTAQRDAIDPEASTSPNDVDGLLIYNIDTDCYNYWNRATTSWMTMCQTSTVCDPSTWSVFTVDCTQFNLVDTNNYTIGTDTTGNTIVVTVDVTKVGPYSITINSNSGVNYAGFGNFTALGNHTVTVSSTGGAPTSSPINFSVKSNGNPICTYSKAATNSFSYNYNCSQANITPVMTQNMAGSGTIVVPIAITGSGNIPSFTQFIDGVTYSFPGITAANSSTTTISITYTGTPTSLNSVLPLNNYNSSTCNVIIANNPAFAVTYTCGASNPAANTRQFTVGAATSGTFTIPVSVTGTGNIPSTTNTSNGITYTTTAVPNATSATNTITVTYNGTPTAAGTSDFIIGSCNYSHAVNAAFAVTYSCAASNPAASTRTFTAGTPTSGTFTIPVSVTGTGNIPSTSNVSNGITYVTTAVNNATSSTTAITVNYSGTPTAAGTSDFTIGSSCAYSHTVNPAFTTTYTCNASTPSTITFTQGTNMTGSFTIPVSVTGTGTIPSVTNTSNGITYTSVAVANATSATTAITVNYTGAAVNGGTTVFTIGSCNYSFPVDYTNAEYTNTCSVQVFGSYVVATPLNGTNYIEVTLNVTKSGKIKFVTQDLNGMKFESADNAIVQVGSQVVTLTPVTAISGIFPLTAEEQGNNADNQSANYIITNSLTATNLSCVANIDVKPRVWSTVTNLTGVTTLVNGPVNDHIILNMQDQSTLQGGFSKYFKVWVSNVSTTNWSNVSSRTRSTYESLNLVSWNNGTITPNERLGSLDAYLQTGSVRPVFTLETGAHAGPETGGEVSDNGVTFQWTAPATGGVFAGLGTKFYKYRVVYYSTSQGVTQMNLVLLGIYNTTSTWTPGSSTVISEAIGGKQRYWP